MKHSLCLLPVPRRIEWTGGQCSASAAAPVTIDPTAVPHPQGYRLTIDSSAIRIVAHDPAGAFYAQMTLKQLARQARDVRVPCLTIEDWPDFPHRGVMLDVSRDKVPTMATLFELVDRFAEWKLNQLQLYTEHTFAYRNHREVWEHASPMTAEQVRELDAYCKDRFIELVPNQNSFGHMERWLKHPRYRPLAEATDGYDSPWGDRRTIPATLDPENPASIQLIAELYDELLPNFSSRLLNVGCDETSELGQGNSKQACADRGVGRVYLDFLLKLHRLACERDRTMMFWGDIIMHHPELIGELPKDVIALEWGYEADHPFAADGQKFAAAGIRYYVCPGTSSWNTIAGRTDNAIRNLQNAAENGLANGAIGYLVTDWGDNGHWQHLPVSFLGYAFGAAMSWCAQAGREINLPAALDVHAFEDSAGVMGKLAHDLGNAYQQTGAAMSNSSPLQMLLLPDRAAHAKALEKLSIEALVRTRDSIDQTLAPLGRSQMARPDASWIIDEYRSAADLMRHACNLGIALLQTPDKSFASLPADGREQLAAELRPLIADHRRLWLNRNREGGLALSAGRLEKLLERYEAKPE